MHGPAALSILVGKNLGVAPDANIIYAAIPSWKADQSYVIKAIEWIIEENKKLSVKNKVKAISISASPPDWSKNTPNHWVQDVEEYNKNLKEWEKAEQKALDNNIIIISCVQNKYKFGSCYYDIDNPDDFNLIKGGFPNRVYENNNELLLPTSLRTIAEYYEDGIKSYSYEGVGGLSWGIPYLCGCMALGWQINPTILGVVMMQHIHETAFKNGDLLIINPNNFIKRITKTK